MTKYSEKTKYFFVHTINPYTGNSEVFDALFDTSDNAPFVPLPVKPYYVSTAETASLIFDASIKRWVDKEFQDREEKKKLHTFERQVNEEMIKRFVDFQSAKTLVELLTKIPNFNVALTEQEKDVIGQNGNVLAIGRSGTGKTTCAVLRLFSIEMLFKIRLSLYKKKFGDTIKDTRCSS